MLHAGSDFHKLGHTWCEIGAYVTLTFKWVNELPHMWQKKTFRDKLTRFWGETSKIKDQSDLKTNSSAISLDTDMINRKWVAMAWEGVKTEAALCSWKIFLQFFPLLVFSLISSVLHIWLPSGAPPPLWPDWRGRVSLSCWGFSLRSAVPTSMYCPLFPVSTSCCNFDSNLSLLIFYILTDWPFFQQDSFCL